MKYARSATIAALPVLLLCGSASLPAAPPVPCPQLSNGRYTFPDGAFAMRTPLQVNPDGATASYMPGDHGQTYIRNGVNRIDADGHLVFCSKKVNHADCRTRFLAAEAHGFARGTDKFCVFAFEVEAFGPGVPRETCGGSESKYIVGDGRGRPKLGRQVQTVTGGTSDTYLSMTALKHRVGTQAVYLDSSSVPVSVTPTPSLLGAIVYIRYRGQGAFALIGDSGPAFGEGSVALHQLLRETGISVVQPVGPIPLADRCKPFELNLPAPFTSFPDLQNDKCRPGYTARGATDLRAYNGIDYEPGKPYGANNQGVEMIVLQGARLPKQGGVIQVEVTPARLAEAARAAGYDLPTLAGMADCVRQ